METTQISTELAIALLTILLHYHPKKASSSYHLPKIRIIKPIIPVDATNDYKEPLSEPKAKNVACTSTVQEKGSDQPHNPSGALNKVIVMMADNIEHVCNEAIAGVILENGYNLKKTMEKTAEQSSSRSFNALDMLGISKMSDILCREHNNYEQEPTMNSHMMNLQRQLPAGFGLKIDPIQRDGDCAFRSVITKRSQ